MGRIIGIDYGRKRTGIAVTDSLKIVANGLTTVPSHTVIDFLLKYIEKENVEKIVVGLPKQLNGQDSESMQYITPFLNRLKKVLPQIPVVMYDERFTSTLAHKAMLDGGMKELLSELSQLGVKIAVASNKYQQATEKIVQHFFPETDFVTINGQQEGIPVKPDPSIVFDILAKAGVTKDETVFIGDSGVDMDTARRACIDSIGVTWGFRPEKELIEHFADKIVYKPSEILEIIKNYSSKLVD